MFRWHSAFTATDYRICIATDSLFSNIVVNTSQITDTMVMISSLDYKTTYFWFVEPSNAAGPGALSTIWKFTTDIERPAQASPVNGAIDQPLRSYFIWHSVSNVVTYRLQIATDSMFTNIIHDDSTLKKTSKWVSGLNAATVYYWRVRSINTINDTAWSILIYHFRTILENAITSDISIEDLWNLVSVPLTVTDYSTGALFPGALTGAYSYSGTYVEEAMLNNGIGYWIKYDSAKTITQIGIQRLADTIDVMEGWNLIGSLTYPVPVATIQSDVDTMVLSNFFGYYGSYFTTDTLYPGKGYWVNANQGGKLILSTIQPSAAAHFINIVPASELPPNPPIGNLSGSTGLIPVKYDLGQNYPNPFNPLTRIFYSLPELSKVQLEIFNTLGQKVSTLVSGEKESGYYTIEWNAGVSSGLYFYRLIATSVSEPGKIFTQVRKMLLVR
jgi:hypothetical protein